MAIGNAKHFASGDEFRAWLEGHHAAESELWLVRYKKHTGKPTIAYEEAVEEALCFGWIDGLVRRIDEERYAIRFSPRKPKSTWSQANKERVERMITEGRMTEAGLARVRDGKASGEWHNAASREDPAQMPNDLQKALAANPAAQRSFEALAPSYRKQYVWWVMSAKREETRLRRAAETIRMVLEGKKPGID
ncbi:MAG: hypothetical protein FJZ95_05800 [Chloroflexi bacterium]|nr:hypothetical protein [Chloroflexota bacterium]